METTYFHSPLDMQVVLERALRGGKFVSVAYVARGDGVLRRRTVRKGVSKYVTGAGANYVPAEHGLVRVYDMTAKGYRTIAVEGITEIRSGFRRFVKV